MTIAAVGRISRIEFQTDLTRGNAPFIPLGFLLEGAWIDQARWLGLIGRTALTRSECNLINLATWPELEKPFHLLERLFDRGWDAEWGGAGSAIQEDWCRSALLIDVADASSFIANLPIETEADWVKTTDILAARLSALGGGLRSRLPPAPLPAPPPSPSTRGTTPARRLPFAIVPTGRRMQEAIAS